MLTSAISIKQAAQRWKMGKTPGGRRLLCAVSRVYTEVLLGVSGLAWPGEDSPWGLAANLFHSQGGGGGGNRGEEEAVGPPCKACQSHLRGTCVYKQMRLYFIITSARTRSHLRLD